MNAGVNELYISRDRHYEIKEVKATDIDINNRNSAHSLLVSQIDENSVVLDLGCSYGHLGKWLVKNKNCTVYGIEIDEIVVDQVRSEAFYNDIFEIDLDFFEKNPKEFERFKNLDIQFDYIIYADVLEHLKDPTTALATMMEKLKESGKILISIPNIANIDVTLNMIEGRFNYSQVGILDSTHLRFFTKTSFVEWIQSINSNILKVCSLDIELIGSTETLSEFAGYVKTKYPDTYNILVDAMGEDARALQYVFMLTKNKRDLKDHIENRYFETETKHIQLIDERLHELNWALECASRILKKKHKASSRHLRRLLASEKMVVNLEKKLKEKDDVLQKLLSHAYQIEPMNIKVRSPVITDRISVIIPVQNGGEQLESLLGMIRTQRKVQDVEIVIIDSGSTDNSLSIAEEFKARVIRIPQSEFNHGKTRNFGASEASGEYLVFTVQDAKPINNYWLYNMVCPFIEYPDLAALTSKQFVKPEADLFSLWMAQNMTDLLGFKQDSIYSFSGVLDGFDWRFLDSTIKRKVTFLDNVSSCIRGHILKEFQFSPLINAEDIDFGVRLFKNSKPMGYLTSTGVTHWHERGPDYVFKRHYMGTKSDVYILKNDLLYFFDNNSITWENLIANIAGTYELISNSIAGLGDIDSEPVRAIRSFVNVLKQNMSLSFESLEQEPKDEKIQDVEGMELLLGEITGNTDFSLEQKCNFTESFLIQNFIKRFQDFTDYLYRKHATLAGREMDFVSCIYKIFAVTAGEALGAYYLEAETLNRLTPELERIDRLLGKGVCYF